MNVEFDEHSTNFKDGSYVIHSSQARSSIPHGDRLIRILQRGSVDVVFGAPSRPNEQTPHDRDEFYFAVQGRGIFFHDGKREPFEAGDLLFVAAFTEHHFEDFSEDLLVWRVFFGPKGGEVPTDSRE